MADQIQLRGDTAANWASTNPVLAEREIAITTDGDSPQFKVGDGVKTWSALPYMLKGETGAAGHSAGEVMGFTLVASPAVSLCSAVFVAPCAMTIQQIDINARTVENAAQAPSASTNAVLYKNGTSFDTRAFTGADTQVSSLTLSIAAGEKLDLRLSAANGLDGSVSITYRGVRA